ncbi:uncharacterized protein LOC110606893 [Manihot esculenta]|uniref:Uncharacterized protein n=2 Tax=Manihot esculenta TaxID=3983 RepID=A0A2C9WG30_MANES|nr:uncharacterized protein LOC110606893 [Manihot esculenta]KAG8661199.1 hypothetical protein MANES_02G219300v8 [Manihot esculenta]OAY58950.1 hypothetical protein MANES_02G219300v8 [Manihot esculenta]
MSNPYERVKGGRLTFKGGSVATSSKAIDKKKKKKKNKIKDEMEPPSAVAVDTEHTETGGDGGGGAGEIYTIDAAKRLQYEELFPVETKKFGYNEKSNFKSVEDALDDRVKKKADRYCK